MNWIRLARRGNPLNVFRETEFYRVIYEGWNFNNGNYLFTTDTK